MHTKTIAALIAVLLWITACSRYPKEVEYALRLAGDNRAELEKVLEHYRKQQKDKQKYRAACFLIANMPFYYGFEDDRLEKYQDIYRVLATDNQEPQAIADSFKTIYGTLTKTDLQKKNDIQTIAFDYLFRNIEWAFKVREEQPWGKNVTFDDFCDYILPYRLGDEKLVEWRQEIYEKYNPLLDSLRSASDADDPFVAARTLTNLLRREKSRFTSLLPDLPCAGPYHTTIYRSGTCRELAHCVAYICRALGIPCGMDYMPLRGNENVSHSWNFFLDKTGNTYMQEFPDSIKPAKHYHTAKLKVYRTTYSLNREAVLEMNTLEKSIHPNFGQLVYTDVTKEYTDSLIKKLIIPKDSLYQQQIGSKIAYLCLPNYMDWFPVTWAPVGKDAIQFSDIEGGNIVRIATWENNRLVFQSPPFFLEKDGRIHYLKAKPMQRDICLFYKYWVAVDTHYHNRMLAGVFEASNDKDFLRRDTIYTVNDLPKRLFIKAYTKSNKQYRYVRYYGAEKTRCNVAEIALYRNKNDTLPLQGKIIGTPGCWLMNGKREYTNVFDGKTDNFFDYKEPSGGWSGLDLGVSTPISKIVFTPRNRDNFIRKGRVYELFYCDKEWKSAGKVIASADSLLFRNIPENALLYLKCLWGGKHERVFTYENDKQVFW